MWLAITREVSSSIARCELTHIERQVIDLPIARLQHRLYEQALAGLGCQVHSLPEAPDLPDSVFIEDAAVVFDELAIITRPGAVSRRSETEAVAEALKPYRELRFIEFPGTMDGGDVLVLGKRIFVGITPRTNPEGINQMRTILAPLGYIVKGIPVSGCLHLKSAVTQVGPEVLLVNRNWVSPNEFTGFGFVEVDPREPFAANALLLEEKVIFPSGYPRTRERLLEQGVFVIPVDSSELAKAEGGVTCCSLIFKFPV